MKFLREILHNTLKFPEFEVVIWKALVVRDLVWELANNAIVLWVWSGDPRSFDLEESDMRIWYERYTYDV